jgi:hypothetical protein
MWKRTWGVKLANGIFDSENGNHSRTLKEKKGTTLLRGHGMN